VAEGLVLNAAEAIAEGYDSCTVTSVPADIEAAVLAQVQRLLTTPEMIARTWTATKGELHEREVLGLLTDFGSLWAELFPGEQARIMKLLVERVDVTIDGLEVRLRADGLASLVAELRQQPVPAKAA
jgi:site-specific DNA recombinase